MRTKMPDVIDAYIQASNGRDADRFGSLFSDDAIRATRSQSGENSSGRTLIATSRLSFRSRAR
jgi:hypothetical protein